MTCWLWTQGSGVAVYSKGFPHLGAPPGSAHLNLLGDSIIILVHLFLCVYRWIYSSVHIWCAVRHQFMGIIAGGNLRRQFVLHIAPAPLHVNSSCRWHCKSESPPASPSLGSKNKTLNFVTFLAIKIPHSIPLLAVTSIFRNWHFPKLSSLLINLAIPIPTLIPLLTVTSVSGNYRFPKISTLLI